ncbi:MAG: response regulator [Betaproteobacteria bacterium]|nr:response regulator [Betaproteobacteria bacterium]
MTMAGDPVQTLLLADDDRVVLFTLAEGLREAGYAVLVAQDGVRALELCQREAIDLALLDIRMPGLDGLELARRLRDETAVPFLFLTAYDDGDLVQQAVDAGALGYLVKPLSVPSLLPALRTALARAAEISELAALNQGLKDALSSNRVIGAAVGLVMARSGLNRGDAFETLRKQARDHCRRLEDLAREMVEDAPPVETGSGRVNTRQ